MHRPELYLPATDAQLRQFSERLDRVICRMTGMVEEFDQFEFENKIGVGEGEVWRFSLAYGGDEVDRYELITQHAFPVSKNSGPEQAIKIIRDFNGITDEDMKNAQTTFRDESGTEITVDLNDEPEGFIEHERRLVIEQAGDAINSHKTVTFNILDEDLGAIDSMVGVTQGALDGLLVNHDLHLLEDGQVVHLDSEFLEFDLSMPTPADLIIATHGLIRCGLVSPTTVAYRGAGKYMPLLGPDLVRTFS